MKNVSQNQQVAIAAFILLVVAAAGYQYKTAGNGESQSEPVVEVTDEGVVADVVGTSSTSTIAVSSADEPTESTEELAVEPTPPVVEVATPLIPVVPAPVISELEPEPEPVVETTGVTAAHQSTLVARHNATRAEKGLTPLTWSSSIAASAQAWADNLGGRGCVLEHSNTPYGENLAFSWTTGALKLNSAQAVAWWVDEEQYYDYDTNSCDAGQQCGHYTQVVWANTTQVGCGVTTCSDGGRNTQMWVCQYSPAGNVIGQKPY